MPFLLESLNYGVRKKKPPTSMFEFLTEAFSLGVGDGDID